MINWIKGLFCAKKAPIIRYEGMTVIGYLCPKCGYEWYEKRYK